MSRRGSLGLMSRVLIVAVGFAFFPASEAASQKDEPGFRSLFNGVDLTGWTAEGFALVVQEGALTGNPKGPGLIRTEQTFSDFVLRLEFWVDRGKTHEGNGGIFFRMGRDDEGYESQISTHDPINPSASLYNEVPQSLELVRSIAREKQWNRVQIRALGPRIQVWYNDEQLQDATLHDFDSGSIGLQHHHNGCTIRYRNIRIKELSSKDAEPGWEPILNSSNLDGWTAKGRAEWSLDGAQLTGRGGLGNLYYTAREYSDFELRLMSRISAKGNSGLIFRSHWPEADPDDFAMGFECQIDNWDMPNTTGIKNVTGAIFGRFPAPLLTRDEAWFSMRVRARGDHLESWINGRKVTDFHDDSFASGFIALQGYGEGVEVRFRDIFVREIE